MRIKDERQLVKYRDDYSEPKLWAKLSRTAGRLGRELVYQTLVLYYVLKSPDVPLRHKSVIVGALGYLILPLDMIPDAIPLLGFTDDAGAIAMALDAVRSSVTPAIEAQARRKTDEWF